MKIGKIIQLDLRDIWKNEASEFTKWLSANLGSLSEIIGINLDFLEAEKKLDDSRFSIDIWAADEDGNSVIIENQLEKTDHTHLGQLITYAANMDAETVIWISKAPRQEHINAINWLNQFADKSFYLVQVSAIKIEDSVPAPQFNLICKPSKEVQDIGKSKKEFVENKKARRIKRSKSDTLIVPAQKEGFEKVFIGEDRWHSIRIRESRIPQIKYIAAYQVAPVSSVTHLAEVKEIIPSPYQEGKYMVVFSNKAKKITPIPLGNGNPPQSPVYCEYERLKGAKDLSDALSLDHYADDEAA